VARNGPGAPRPFRPLDAHHAGFAQATKRGDKDAFRRRYSYQSHGLRFDLRRATESTLDFRKRINDKALDQDERLIWHLCRSSASSAFLRAEPRRCITKKRSTGT
jgi:hypothetical protein